MKKPLPYKYMRAWHRFINISPKESDERIVKAVEDKAPKDSILFNNCTGTYLLLEEVRNKEFLRMIRRA